MSDNDFTNKNAATKTATGAAHRQPTEGTIRLHRRIIDHDVWNNPEYLKAWIDLLLLARNKDGSTIERGQTVLLKRGEVYRSYRQLVTRWGKSWEWVKSFMKFCELKLMVKVKSSNHGTIITIINYDAYNWIEDQGNCLTFQAQPETQQPSAPPSAEQGAKPLQREKKKEEGESSEEFPEIPSEREIEEFCNSCSDMSRGYSCIPEIWWRNWLSYKLGQNRFPVRWKEALKSAFLADFIARHPRALGKIYSTKNSPSFGTDTGDADSGAARQLKILNKQRSTTNNP